MGIKCDDLKISLTINAYGLTKTTPRMEEPACMRRVILARARKLTPKKTSFLSCSSGSCILLGLGNWNFWCLRSLEGRGGVRDGASIKCN